MKKFILPLLFSWLAVCSTDAQDIHYSQFYNAPLVANPALTGVFGGDVRFMANYRNQWKRAPVDYRTVNAVADMKFINRTARKGFFSGGLAFHYDQAGYSKLSQTTLGLNLSYTQYVSNRFFITYGAVASANQRRFQTEDLTFDNNFDAGSGTYDPALGSGENFPSTSRFFPDFGVGINFRLQSLNAAELIDRLEKRTRIDFGIGVHHLTRPDQSFYDTYKSPLPIRISPYVFGVIQLTRNLDAVSGVVGHFQDPHQQFLALFSARYHLSRRLGRQLAIQLGVGYRFARFGQLTKTEDAYMPTIEIHYRQWAFGFSHDVNTSGFNIASQRRGGPEISIRYILRKVRPLPYFKHCPII